jgi:hypothetical protein
MFTFEVVPAYTEYDSDLELDVYYPARAVMTV